MSGRKVELDEVTVPAPLFESSSSLKSVPVIPTPMSEEANDDDYETLDQVTIEPRRSSRVWSTPEWYGNPVLVDLPDDRQAIENKWIFKRKTDPDSSGTIYKARLVAKDFRQVQGVDYNEIFSNVAMLKSVQIMLVVAIFYEIK